MSTDNREVNLEDLYDTYTSDEQVKEANARRTVDSGRYSFQAEKVQAKQLAGDHQLWPDRMMATFSGYLSQAGVRKGRLMFDASWDVVKNQMTGKQDTPSKLWGQLVVAMDAKGKAVAEVLELAKAYPFGVYITEGFKTGNGYIYPRTPEEKAEAFKAGYEARNFVSTVFKEN